MGIKSPVPTEKSGSEGKAVLVYKENSIAETRSTMEFLRMAIKDILGECP